MSQFSKTISQSDISSMLTSALNDHKTGNYQSALDAYNNVVPYLTGKAASSVYSNMGAIYLNILGDDALAKTSFEESVKADDTNVSAHYNLAVILTTKFGQHAKSIKHAKLALAQDPTHYKAVHLLGNILQNMGKDIEAQRYFVMAAEMAQGQQQELQQQQQQQSTATDSSSSSSGLSGHLLSRLPLMNMTVGDVRRVNLRADADHDKELIVTCVSARPRLFVVDNFLTAEECEMITTRSQPLLQPSHVMGGSYDTTEASSGSKADSYRVSENCWLPAGAIHPLLPNVQERLSLITGLPVAYLTQQSEQLQVVRYQEGGHFSVHQDSSQFHKRLLTALMYLNDVPEEADGATWFPFASSSSSPSQQQVPGEEIDSVETAIASARIFASDSLSNGTPMPGISVHPKKGTIIIFFNHLEDETIDPFAVHAGLPVKSNREVVVDAATSEAGVVPTGEVTKWVANYWIGIDTKLLSDLL